jgi:hypothetical protein
MIEAKWNEYQMNSDDEEEDWHSFEKNHKKLRD